MIAQAGSKYDQDMTVVKAKGLRNKVEEIPEDPSFRTKDMQESLDTADTTYEEENEQKIPDAQETEENNNSLSANKAFKLPDNTGKLHQLIQIVNQYPGDQTIHIGDKTFSLSEEGKQLVYDLL